jgi:hypothetical protein
MFLFSPPHLFSLLSLFAIFFCFYSSSSSFSCCFSFFFFLFFSNHSYLPQNSFTCQVLICCHGLSSDFCMNNSIMLIL